MPEALIRDADAAMYRAKERGRARFEVFDEGMRERLVERMETENALRRALEREELRVYYQPEISLDDRRRRRSGGACALGAPRARAARARRTSSRWPRRPV